MIGLQPGEVMSEPIDMVLHCPKCGTQHIDGPDPKQDWHNPPHKSHLCHKCGCVWRPADVHTNGVPAVATKGTKDSWPPPMETTTELQLFRAMLDRAGLGYGTRIDYNPCRVSVQVEHEDNDGDGWFETDWQFDAEGKLVSVKHYRGEVG